MHVPLDPRIVNVFIDANALDRPDPDRAKQVEQFTALSDDDVINVIASHTVIDEVQNPNTPSDVRTAVSGGIYTIRTTPVQEERELRRQIEAALQGNAKPGKHAADAAHLAEACKYGAGYFITHDQRVLKKAGALGNLVPPSLQVVTLEEFLKIYGEYSAEYP